MTIKLLPKGSDNIICKCCVLCHSTIVKIKRYKIVHRVKLNALEIFLHNKYLMPCFLLCFQCDEKRGWIYARCLAYENLRACNG